MMHVNDRNPKIKDQFLACPPSGMNTSYTKQTIFVCLGVASLFANSCVLVSKEVILVFQSSLANTEPGFFGPDT